MAIVFCCKWDDSLNGTADPCGANDIVPDSTWNDSITTSNPKFGAGCVQGEIDLEWWELANAPGDAGCFGVWVRGEGSNEVFGDLTLEYYLGSQGKINLYWQMATGATGLQFVLDMNDSGGTTRISASSSEVYTVDGDWHYIEVNWLWDDIDGVSEVSFDGDVKISDLGGNSFSRGAQPKDIELYGFGSPGGTKCFMDDYTLFNTIQHTGNFTPPTAAQCLCSAGPVRLFNLGAPFTSFNPMGR